MKGSLKVVGWALILSIVVGLAGSAPAEKEDSTDPAAPGSKADASSVSQAGQDQVPVPGSADTRADVPASTGGSGAVPVSKPTAVVGTFFDSIFNIPTSVLRAVNQFLNNNIKIGQAQSLKTAAGRPLPANTPAVTSAPATSDVQTEVPVPTQTGNAGSTPSGAPNKPAARSTFFDNIFNIPISAINSVNSLITGRRFGENGGKVPSNSSF